MTKNLFALCLLAGGMAGIAVAQATSAPSKIGVINIQSALVATKDGQKAAADMEQKFAPKKKDLDSRQSEIKDLQEKLQKGGNAMSDSAKEELTRNIDSKTKSYNRQVEDAEAEAQQEQQRVINQLGQKMMQVIDKYAAANGFTVILDVSNPNTPVLYASNTVDITKDIVDLYDKTVAGAAPASAPAKPAAAAPAPAAPKPASPAAPPSVAPAKKQ